MIANRGWNPAGGGHLKPRAAGADTLVMRYQRLVLENSDLAFTLQLHPRLTVIGGVGRGEREGLIGELLGALGGSRRGVRLEVCDDSGRQLVVDRAATPEGDRVTDAATGADVTGEFRAPDGRVDLLSAIGVPAGAGHHLSQVTSFDLAGGIDTDATVARLAAVDQRKLWAAAARCMTRRKRIDKSVVRTATARNGIAVQRLRSAAGAAPRAQAPPMKMALWRKLSWRACADSKEAWRSSTASISGASSADAPAASASRRRASSVETAASAAAHMRRWSRRARRATVALASMPLVRSKLVTRLRR